MNPQEFDEMELEPESDSEISNEIEPANEEYEALETTSLTIKGHLLRWNNYVVQISNISLVSSGEKDPPSFPKWILWTTLIGIIILAYGIKESSGYYSDNELAGGMIGIAILLLAIAVIALVIWINQVWSCQEEKYLHIHMNSGSTYSILFKDKEFLEKKVIPMFSKIFEDGAKDNSSFYIDIRNWNIEDSSIGNTVNKK